MAGLINYGFANPQQFSDYTKYMGIDPMTANFAKPPAQTQSVYAVPPQQMGPPQQGVVPLTFKQDLQNTVAPITDTMSTAKSQMMSGIKSAGSGLLNSIMELF